MDELIPPEDRNKKIKQSTSSRWWSLQAKYYFTANPERFYVVLPSSKALEFSLVDGKFRYAGATAYPELAALLRKANSNEESEVWQISLRFSSITDVQQARNSK